MQLRCILYTSKKMTEYPSVQSHPGAIANGSKPTGYWYYGWNVLAVAFAFQAIVFGLTYYCFTFWVAPWMTEFQTSRSTILSILVFMQVAIGLLSPFAGKALDRFSIRFLVILGILCYALALALIAFAQSLWVIMLLYVIFIVAGNLLAGAMAAQTLATRWFANNRGTAIGLVSVGTSFGGFILPPIVTWLMLSYGWRDTHLILAGAMVVLLVPLVWRVVRNSPDALGLAPQITNRQEKATHSAFPIWTTKMVLRQRAFWIAICGLLPIAITFGAFGQNLASLAIDLQIAPQDTALLVSFMALGMIAGKLFFGRMSDHLDHRYLLWLAGLAWMLCLSTLLLTTPGFSLMLGISALGGFASGSVLPLMGIIVSSHFGAASFGHVVGLLTLFLSLGAVAPWLAGYLRDSQGSYDNAWLIFLCMILISAPIIGFLPSPTQQKETAK